MIELKTLNDLKRKDFDPKVFPELTAHNQALSQAKREAIKWIKEIEKVQEIGDTCLKDHGKIREDFEVDIYDYEQDDSMPMIRILKYFFNISKEDLKDDVLAHEGETQGEKK